MLDIFKHNMQEWFFDNKTAVAVDDSIVYNLG